MTANPTSIWARIVDELARERLLKGASLFRIVAGATILYQFLINYETRHYLYGPNGVVPWDYFVEAPVPSLYSWSPAVWWFELLYHGGIVVAALWMFGVVTRLTTPLNAILWISMHNRNGMLWDGGDNMMQIAILYACLVDVSRHWSFDAWWRARRGPATDRPTVRRALGLAHNTGVLAIVVQVCLIYGISGLYKVQGEVWQNGTAMYYAMRSSEFYQPGLSELIYGNSVLLTIATYTIVFFQVSFPFLVFLGGKWGRRIAVMFGVFFHFGIFAFMHLTTFAFFMISVDVMLLEDADLRWISRQIRRPYDLVRRGVRRLRDRDAEPVADAARIREVA